MSTPDSNLLLKVKYIFKTNYVKRMHYIVIHSVGHRSVNIEIDKNHK